jgi:hypothetical protein
MIEIEKLQQKLGEALGLEMAAQKAVEDLGSKGLLNKSGILTQLQKCENKLVIINQSSSRLLIT